MKARDNPLATHRVLAIRYRPLNMTWEQILNRLRQMNYRGAIVGPKGTGKTTLIEDLSAHLVARGLAPRPLRLSKDHRIIAPSALANLTRRDIVLLDGAEQLNPLRWFWFQWKTRTGGGLIITTHRRGRLPPLLHTTTTPRLLTEIAGELLSDRTPRCERIDELFIRHQGNIREALRELYDDFAAVPG
jgi:hypothetical protein